MTTPFVIECPHCRQLCEIVELNCCIFRCGIYKTDCKQIPPHLPKTECDALVSGELIFGCGKPFRIVVEGDTPEKKYLVQTCDYI
jgi:hypothetical protein